MSFKASVLLQPKQIYHYAKEKNQSLRFQTIQKSLHFFSEPDPYPPSDALPTCLQAYRSCMSNRQCKRIYQEYQSSCEATNDGKCRMENW